MENVFFNYVVDGVVVEGPFSYAEVLERTGFTDTVGFTERGYIELMPVPVVVEITKEQLDTMTRNIRNILLQQSDWTQLLDVQLADAEKAAWGTYRQELRDIPETYATATRPESITWPVAPNAFVTVASDEPA
jgi:hypothetical protein